MRMGRREMEFANNIWFDNEKSYLLWITGISRRPFRDAQKLRKDAILHRKVRNSRTKCAEMSRGTVTCEQLHEWNPICE